MKWIDQLLALARWKRMIIINTLLVAAAAIVISLLLPKWYESTASIFPPEEESNFGLGSLSSLVAVTALGAGKGQVPVWASPSDIYKSILRSRTLREELIERFDLVTVYKQDTIDKTLDLLDAYITVKVTREGIVRITVEDKDPERAAKMANATLEILDDLNRRKRATSAGQARAFIETRLDESRDDLAAAEDALRALQQETGVLEPEEQIRALVRAGAELETQIRLKEVELDILEARLGEEHPDREAVLREVEALRSKLDELDFGAGRPTGEMQWTNRFEIPLDLFADLGLRYLRATREVKVQESIFEFLIQQYEQYRIQERRDTPTVYVLDEAQVPELRIRPIRWIICVSSTLLAFLASVAFAAVLEALSRLKNGSPESWTRVRRLGGELWIGRLLDLIP